MGKLFTQGIDWLSDKCIYFAKLYNLVLAKLRWCSTAGMVSADLAENNGR